MPAEGGLEAAGSQSAGTNPYVSESRGKQVILTGLEIGSGTEDPGAGPQVSNSQILRPQSGMLRNPGKHLWP